MDSEILVIGVVLLEVLSRFPCDFFVEPVICH